MKVLIVDDDPDVRSFLLTCIGTMDCDTVDTAETGEEALGRAVQECYDLVTPDLKMPGVSGLDILSVIRGMMPWSVIAVISGYTEEIPETALEYTDRELSKPIHVDTLQQLIHLTKDLTDKREAIRALSEMG